MAIGLLVIAAAGCGGTPVPTRKAAAPAAKAPPARTATAPAVKSPPAQTATAPAAKPLQKVSLRMPWLVGGYDAPFVLAKAKGYYRQAGFDVSVLQGKGSATTAETVGNGSDTFGITDVPTASLLVSKGLPVTVLAVFVQSTPDSFVSRMPIKTPKDLLGKTLLSAPAAGGLELLPAVVARYGMNVKQLKIALVSPSAMPKVYARNPDSVLMGYSNNSDLLPMKLVPNSVVTLYSAFGINTYNVGLVTSKKEVEAHPNAVRRFVAASIRGWNAALKNPNAAVQATVQAFPNAKRWVISEGLARTIPLLHTKASRGHPIGWMAVSDWKQTLQLMHEYGGLKKVLPLHDYYTSSFLPKS